MKHDQQLSNNKNNLSKEDLLRYRLRSARHKRQAVIDHRDKQLLALYRESDALLKARQRQPWVELKPPIIRGWKRYFIVREDVAQSPAGGFFERILAKINTVQTSHRRDFREKKRKAGRKVHIVREQLLKKLEARDWRKVAFTEKEAAYFDLREEPARYPKGAVNYMYVFREPWRYVLRVRPNLITRMKVPNTAVEARMAEIDGYLDRGDHWKRLNTLRHGGGYRGWKWGPGYHDMVHEARRPFKNVPLHQLIDSE